MLTCGLVTVGPAECGVAPAAAATREPGEDEAFARAQIVF
jgi:hypothetical protein